MVEDLLKTGQHYSLSSKHKKKVSNEFHLENVIQPKPAMNQHELTLCEQV
jgi:hypothetical protein